MFSIHMLRKHTLKCFPSVTAKQLKQCPVMYAVKSSCSSGNCWSYQKRMRFILANVKIFIWFDPGIMRPCICVCVLGKDRTGELRRKSRVDSNESYHIKKAE